MKKIAIILCLAATPATAQNAAFWNNYYAAQNGANSMTLSVMAGQQRRAAEALINLERRKQGLPQCTLAPLRALFTGEPQC